MEDIIFNFYQRLGDYFTGSHRKRPLYIGLLILFLILGYLSYRLKIIVNTETLYWVFSSLVQALLALVALMGVVSVFKLQNLHGDEGRILDESNDPMRAYFTLLNNRYSTIETLKLAIDTYVSNHELKNNLIAAIQQRVDNLLLSRKLVVNYAVKYAVYTFAVATVALLFLIFSPQISAFYLGIISLYLMFILVSYSLFLATKGFAYSIRD